MKLFVTGSDGSIGNALASECRKLGIEVVGADIQTGFDIRSKDIAKHIPEEVDAIVHLAALSNDTLCKNNGYACFDLNVLGTLNLMEAAVERRAKQFIFASTEWVYDNCTADETKNEESPIDIKDHTSEYALSKIVSEANLRQKYQHGFCPITILRFGIVCGTTGVKMTAVESLFFSVKEKSEFSVGSLGSGRCFVHISDIVSGIIKSIGMEGFQIINLSGDKLVTLHEIIDEAKSITHLNPLVTEKSPDAVSIRKISNAKAKKILGWKPEISVSSWLQMLHTMNSGKSYEP